jgi:hypothetical protein
LAYWECPTETPTHGRGETANIELTGLAVQALLKAGQASGTVGKAVNYLVQAKDAFGSWHSTQATIQALRAMLIAERDAPANSGGQVTVALNGTVQQTLAVSAANADLLRLVDLSSTARTGDNAVKLSFNGEGRLLYQVVGRFFLPTDPEGGLGPDEPLTISLAYDRTHLATDDILDVTATVAFRGPGSAKMVIVDLGLAPGFTLLPDRLDQLVADRTIQKYSVTGRQIIVYLEELVVGAPLEISYQLLAKYPLRAKTGRSVIYEYYNPQCRAEIEPVELTVVQM